MKAWLLLAIVGTGTVFAQTAPSANDAARRDTLLQPALALMRSGDNVGALTALGPVVLALPHDVPVLALAAQAAANAGQYEQALGYFTRALAEDPAGHSADTWKLRLGKINMEAKLERWEAFNADVAALRAAKRAGTDPGLAQATGFSIDSFTVNGVRVQGVVFPLLEGNFHTLYRFILPQLPPAGPIAGGQAATNAGGDRRNNPDFRPYFNVESDDVDQAGFVAAHPDRAAKGERSYSLDTYPAPGSQGLIKFYSDGEPSYETARKDVMNSLGKQK